VEKAAKPDRQITTLLRTSTAHAASLFMFFIETGHPSPHRGLDTKPHGRAHFGVTAQNVCKLHLPWRAEFRREKSWAADHYASAARPRRGDIEAVEIVQKFHAARARLQAVVMA